MRLIPRLTTALSGLVFALGGVVAVAPAAHAGPHGCYYTVLAQDHESDPEVAERACLLGSEGGSESLRVCYTELRRDYVPAVTAYEACRRAAEE